MSEARVAEALGALSLATELAVGVPPETAMRAAVLGVELAHRAKLQADEVRDVYYTALLRYIGCTGFAHETAWYGAGDDIGFLGVMTPPDTAVPAKLAPVILKNLGKGAPALKRATATLASRGSVAEGKRRLLLRNVNQDEPGIDAP